MTAADTEIVLAAEDPRSLEPAELVRLTHGRALASLDGTLLPLAAHPYLAYLTHYENESSRETMKRALEDACAVLDVKGGAAKFPWWFMRRTHMQILRMQLAAEYAPATANRILTAVRGVLKECFRADMISAHDYTHAIDISRVKGYRELSGRALEHDEIELMLAQCDVTTALGARNHCLVSTFRNCGFRRHETTKLDLDSYAHDSLRIIGKGNKQRTVHVNKELAASLACWIGFRGDAPGALFYKASPDGIIVTGERLSYSGMQHAVLTIAKRANVEDVSLHDFRRTLIGDLLDDGTDLAVVSKIVGHSSVDTTSKYDRRGERASKKALDRRAEVISETRKKTEGEGR